jgi:hypothetical protein
LYQLAIDIAESKLSKKEIAELLKKNVFEYWNLKAPQQKSPDASGAQAWPSSKILPQTTFVIQNILPEQTSWYTFINAFLNHNRRISHD